MRMGKAAGERQPLAKHMMFTPGHRHRMNIVAICVNLFLPSFFFASIFCIMSFSFHWKSPVWTWTIVAFAYVIVFGTGLLAFRSKKRDRDPMWLTYSTLALFIATTAAVIAGDFNYTINMDPYYTIMSLNSYPSVDPTSTTGQQVMDAGRIFFSDGCGLDTKKSMSFQDDDLYCVVPVVNGKQEGLAQYDFWAVGINCCSGTSSDFRCGEFNNPYARSGLRLMRDDVRNFFRLAVQMAEAAYNIQSPHPLFFYWMQDPVHEINTYRDDGLKVYLFGVFMHFAFNIFCIITAIIGFSKIGRLS